MASVSQEQRLASFPYRAFAPSPVRRSAALGTLILVVLVAVGAASLYRAPGVVPASAPGTTFSAERAFRHVEAIAKEPHPVESAANEAVVAYLMAELRALGLEPQVQEADIVRREGEAPRHLRNVVARLPGTANTRAVMLSAHHDSVSRGPGAADNAAVVAAILETVRALRAGSPLRNDLIVVFPDGEEMGLLGARAFMREHPWRGDVGLVFSFDARGSRGPVLMYETSAHNGTLVAEFTRAVHPVFATSLAAFIYRQMPNGSDFSVYQRAGLEGLNFAFIEGVENYHRPTDTPANLDPRSLQHDGEIMLGLVRHFGDADLPLPPAGDRVYFNLLGSWVVHHPISWVLPIALLLAAGAIVLLGCAWRGARVRLGRTMIVLPAVVVTVAATGGFSVWGISWVRRLTESGLWNLVIVASVTIAAFAGTHMLLRRWLRLSEVAMGVQVVWLGGALATAVWLPEGAYLLFWPSALGWIGLALALRRGSMIGHALPVLGAALFFGPMLQLLAVAFPRMPAAVIVPSTIVLPVLFIVIDPLLPWRWTSEGRARRVTAAV